MKLPDNICVVERLDYLNAVEIQSFIEVIIIEINNSKTQDKHTQLRFLFANYHDRKHTVDKQMIAYQIFAMYHPSKNPPEYLSAIHLQVCTHHII